MPKGTTIKPNQKIEGTHSKYWFTCEIYGDFYRDLNSLISGSWKNGTSGHPKPGYLQSGKSRQMKVINIDTGEVFRSVKEVSCANNASSKHIYNALSGKNKTAGGYRWAYCDDNGNIIK